MSGFVIENKGGSITDQQQSVGNERDFDIIQTGNSRVDCVLEGCVVTPQGTPNEQYVAVSNGSVLTNGVLKAVAAVTGSGGGAGTATDFGGAPDTTYYRIDVLVVNSSGALARRAGTAAAIPLMPTLTANDVPIAAILVPPDSDGLPVAILTNDITDKRMLVENGPITLYKTIAAETTNTTTAAINLLNKAGAGVVIPADLMQVGRVLRVRLGGNYLHSSAASMTFKLEVILGGTVLYSAISGSITRTLTVRGAWFVTFDLMYQAAADVTMNGKAYFTQLTPTKVAPTTGIGQGWLTGENVWAFSGGSATPTNASNRTLQVTMTFSSSNVSKEIVTEYATVELL